MVWYAPSSLVRVVLNREEVMKHANETCVFVTGDRLAQTRSLAGSGQESTPTR